MLTFFFERYFMCYNSILSHQQQPESWGLEVYIFKHMYAEAHLGAGSLFMASRAADADSSLCKRPAAVSCELMQSVIRKQANGVLWAAIL